MIFTASTKNEIIEYLYKNNVVKPVVFNLLFRIGLSQSFTDDIVQEVYLLLLEEKTMPLQKLQNLLQNKHFNFYLVGFVNRQLTSKSSTAIINKKYTKYESNKNEFDDKSYSTWLNAMEDEIQDDNTELCQIAQQEFDKLDWYSKKIWQLYNQSGMTYMKLSKQTNISHNSLHNTIKSARNKLKNNISDYL